MGRRRQYGSGAERQRAFRQRQAAEWVEVDRRDWERLHERLKQLHEAVRGAASAGDRTAQACRAGSEETVLERLIRHFEGRARSQQAGGNKEGAP
jgi:hypothetical protein